MLKIPKYSSDWFVIYIICVQNLSYLKPDETQYCLKYKYQGNRKEGCREMYDY